MVEGWKGKIFYAPCLASVGDKIPEPVEMTVTPSGEEEGEAEGNGEGGNVGNRSLRSQGE